MTEAEVISLIRSKVAEAGSMRAVALQWGISVPYVSDLLNGRRSPGPKVLNPLGLERVKVIDYRLKA